MNVIITGQLVNVTIQGKIFDELLSPLAYQVVVLDLNEIQT